MPLSTFTSSTDVEELIETELIDEYVAGFEYPLGVGMTVAQRKTGLGNVPVRFPRWNEIDLSGIGPSHSESVDAVDVDITTTESSITPALQIFRMAFPDEAAVATRGKVPAQALAEALRALANRMDINILAASTSATLATGTVATPLTLQGLRTALTYARAQDIPATSYNIVLGNSAAGSLWESMGSTSASYAMAPDDMTRFGAQSGFQGRLLNQAIFQSNNVAADSTGWSNFLVPAMASSLGVVVEEMPNLRPTRGDEAETRAVSFVVTRAWWGAAIINPRQFIELLSS